MNDFVEYINNWNLKYNKSFDLSQEFESNEFFEAIVEISRFAIAHSKKVNCKAILKDGKLDTVFISVD